MLARGVQRNEGEFMSDLDGLIDLIPIGDIAEKLGIDEGTARAAVAVAVPAIVGGLAANAQDAGGAKSLENALDHHTGKTPTKVADIDTADGAKIVKNVFGAKQDDVVAAVASKTEAKGGVDLGAIVAQVLPIIAPIVLAYIANQFASKKAEAPAAKEAEATSPDLGGLLGGLLGSQQGQDVLGGLLGGLLGGGRK
jgi:hypothetical protein